MYTSVNAANQVVSVGADIAFDADPKCFACLVRFESSSVPFFFQAEDGIRDLTVTGVQTCALPISEAEAEPAIADHRELEPGLVDVRRQHLEAELARLVDVAHDVEIGRASCRERV